MKSIRKFISAALAAALLLSGLAGCAKTENVIDGGHGVGIDNETVNNISDPATTVSDPVTIRLGGLTGPTTIGLVKLLEDSSAEGSELKIDYKLAGSADELTPLLIKGELDVLAGPANLAAVLNAKTKGEVQMLAVTTLGVLSILTTAPLPDAPFEWSMLKGQTIYATGKGSTPEYNLRYLLTKNGLDPDKDVDIQFKSEPAEIVALLKAGTEKPFVMLPQPFATAAQIQVEGLKPVLDLSAEWDKLGEKSKMVTACLMVRKEFAEAHPQELKALIEACRESAEWVNTNVKDAAALTEKYIGVKAAIAEKAIPLCNITFMTEGEMFEAASSYFRGLYDQNPASVGGALPGKDFYY